MSIHAITTLMLADSGGTVGWTITAALTLVLIGLPVLYLFVLILTDSDDAFERRVRSLEQPVAVKNRVSSAISRQEGIE